MAFIAISKRAPATITLAGGFKCPQATLLYTARTIAAQNYADFYGSLL